MKRFALFGGILLLSACGGEAVDEDDEDNNGSGLGGLLDNDGEGEDDTGFQASADAPQILSADVSCDYSEC